ncbi:hypothetical protein OROHE_000374 [Orobanche hederae]
MVVCGGKCLMSKRYIGITKDCESIMLNEVSVLQNQIKDLQLKHIMLFNTLRQLEASDYKSGSGSCSAYLANFGSSFDANVTFNGLPAWSVSFLPDCKNVFFNTAKSPSSSIIDDVDYIEPMMVSFGNNVKALQVSCGFNHTAAILDGGSICVASHFAFLGTTLREQLAHDMDEKVDKKVRENAKLMMTKIAEWNPELKVDISMSYMLSHQLMFQVTVSTDVCQKGLPSVCFI